MSVEVERVTVPCNICSAAVTELRRGRCWGCYLRWVESRPVGRGATCTVCFEKRRAELKLVELKGRSLPFCHGCAAHLIRLTTAPDTIEELREILRRDRRRDDRRHGVKVDHRIFPRERRVGERRTPPRDAFADTDPRIRLAELDDIMIELHETDLEEVEQTLVRARPLAPDMDSNSGSNSNSNSNSNSGTAYSAAPNTGPVHAVATDAAAVHAVATDVAAAHAAVTDSAAAIALGPEPPSDPGAR